jgi:hypothetical protein
VASGLQKIPTVVSFSLVIIGQYFCDAIALFAGAAFYAFLVSGKLIIFLVQFTFSFSSIDVIKGD